MRPGEGKKTNYKIRGTVLDASGNLFNVLLIPVTREGVANWSCSCGSDSDSPTPCRHTAMIAREWVQHLESLPERRKLVDWLKAEERNTPQ